MVSISSLLTCLSFIVRKKELKQLRTVTEDGEVIIEKGNMDVEMTIDALHFKNKYNVAIFFLVSYLRRDSKKVYIFSSKNNVSEEMRTGGDGYFDVLKIQEDIWGRQLEYKKK